MSSPALDGRRAGKARALEYLVDAVAELVCVAATTSLNKDDDDDEDEDEVATRAVTMHATAAHTARFAAQKAEAAAAHDAAAISAEVEAAAAREAEAKLRADEELAAQVAAEEEVAARAPRTPPPDEPITCGCCCADFLFHEMVQCDQGLHLFCTECLRRCGNLGPRRTVAFSGRT